MLEKLFLASILTFSFGLFADIGWFDQQTEIVNDNSHSSEQIVSALFKRNEQITTNADKEK